MLVAEETERLDKRLPIGLLARNRWQENGANRTGAELTVTA